MRDSRLNFGALALAVKATEVYSADYIDFGAVSAAYPFGTEHTYEGTHRAIFSLDAALAAGDSVDVAIQDSADGSTFETILADTSQAVAQGAGVCAVIPLPLKHRRYVRAAMTPQSTGTFAAVAAQAWLEAGRSM